jgi:hypothetical protein
MPGIKRKKCLNCKTLFIPDARNVKRQRYCLKPQCRKASKAASQKRWLEKPENRDYFRGPENVQRVRHWRKQNPEYWRRPSKTSVVALQEPLKEQPVEKTDNCFEFTSNALQDLLTSQTSVLIGIIAQLTGYALQDDIAMAARRMQQFGNDILNLPHEGGRHGNQTAHLPRSGP